MPSGATTLVRMPQMPAGQEALQLPQVPHDVPIPSNCCPPSHLKLMLLAAVPRGCTDRSSSTRS